MGIHFQSPQKAGWLAPIFLRPFFTINNECDFQMDQDEHVPGQNHNSASAGGGRLTQNSPR